VAAGETLANAYRILGIDLPDDYEVAPDEPEPESMPLQLQMAQQPPELVEDEQVKSQLWHDDAARLKTWYKKRPDADIAEFKSNELSYLDKLEILSEMNRDAGIYDWRNYP
jgi:hypothetical protein